MRQALLCRGARYEEQKGGEELHCSCGGVYLLVGGFDGYGSEWLKI